VKIYEDDLLDKNFYQLGWVDEIQMYIL